MALLGNIPFSATTSTVLFGGKEVGQLQNMTWDENHNLRRINSIGSSVPVALLKGVSEYNLRANKAFIDADLIATLVRGVTKDELGTSTAVVSTTGRVNTVADTTANDLTTSVTSALTTAGGKILVGQKVINLFFSVKVQSLSSIGELLKPEAVAATTVATLATKDLMTFTECSIQSRSARIDVGALVVMQDVNILALHLQYGVTNPNPDKATTP